MFSSGWRAVGTVSTLVFIVTSIVVAVRRPETRRLPLWSWPLLIFASAALTVGNTGIIRGFFLFVTGGAFAVASIVAGPQVPVLLASLRRTANPPISTGGDAPPYTPRHTLIEGERIELSLHRLRRKPNVVFTLVVEPNGERHMTEPQLPAAWSFDRSGPEVVSAIYPTEFGLQREPLATGDYTVEWTLDTGNRITPMFQVFDRFKYPEDFQ